MIHPNRTIKRIKSPHVDLLTTVRDGRKTYRLLSNDLLQNQFFDNWALQLSRTLKFRTVRTYCYAIKTFLNYISQVSLQDGGLTTRRSQGTSATVS